MIYLVQTLKEIKWQTLNTDFVIQADSESDIKMIMNNSKIIVLGSTLVPGWPKSGQFFVTLRYENTQIKCCIASDTIEHACERCIIMWLPVIHIQDIKSNTTQEQSDQLIATYKLIYEKKEEEEKNQEQEQTEKKKALMSDKKQKKIIETINQTLIDIGNLAPEIINNPSFYWDIQQLNTYKEELTKMKLWSNIEKSTIILEQVFAIMEKLELASINNLKQKEQEIISTSSISNIDIMGELEKLKRAKTINDIWINKNNSDIYYTLFWIVWLYQKFIAKDIFKKLSTLQQLLSWWIHYIEFIYIWMSIIGCIVVAWMTLSDQNLSQDSYLNYITLWLLWLTRRIPLLLKGKSNIFLIGWIILAIGITIIIQKVLIVNLALI